MRPRSSRNARCHIGLCFLPPVGPTQAVPLRTFLVATLLALASAQSSSHTLPRQTQWVGSWAASQQLVARNSALDREDLREATLRQIVHLSLGGSEIRLRLSNRYGSAPLHIPDVHVARPASPATAKIEPPSDKAVAFS